MAVIGLLTVVFQVALELIKIRQAHAAKLGVPRLPADQRRALDAAVLQMVRTKDTSALEAMLGGKPSLSTSDATKEPANPAGTAAAPQPVIPPSNTGGKSA